MHSPSPLKNDLLLLRSLYECLLGLLSISVDSFLVSFSQFHLILLSQYDRFLLT